MKYVVLKDFLDRFDNLRHCKPGEEHVPPTEERAKQLLAQGFIAAVPDEEPEKEKPKSEKPKEPKGRGKKDEVKPEGGDNGTETDGE